jgi:hypothetical protein
LPKKAEFARDEAAKEPWRESATMFTLPPAGSTHHSLSVVLSMT